ncbi:MAG: hypothetical protein M1503_11565 [Thaumarchaeota archaeon]|nr:hypothetical protein [Nitrososphaerota archaeon]MCL5318881.1 hypothetical protein [Nitrososphaerota archaeon]
MRLGVISLRFSSDEQKTLEEKGITDSKTAKEFLLGVREKRQLTLAESINRWKLYKLVAETALVKAKLKPYIRTQIVTETKTVIQEEYACPFCDFKDPQANTVRDHAKRLHPSTPQIQQQPRIVYRDVEKPVIKEVERVKEVPIEKTVEKTLYACCICNNYSSPNSNETNSHIYELHIKPMLRRAGQPTPTLQEIQP